MSVDPRVCFLYGYELDEIEDEEVMWDLEESLDKLRFDNPGKHYEEVGIDWVYDTPIIGFDFIPNCTKIEFPIDIKDYYNQVLVEVEKLLHLPHKTPRVIWQMWIE